MKNHIVVSPKCNEKQAVLKEIGTKKKLMAYEFTDGSKRKGSWIEDVDEGEDLYFDKVRDEPISKIPLHVSILTNGLFDFNLRMKEKKNE